MFKALKSTVVSFALLLVACAAPQEVAVVQTQNFALNDVSVKPAQASFYNNDNAAKSSAVVVSDAVVPDAIRPIDESGNAPPPESAVTPQWTESFLEETDSALLKGADGDHVNSYYYFGTHDQRTLIGLERVKGSNFQQYFSLLVFDHQTLLGYYQYIPNLPFFVTETGRLTFPRGYEVEDVILIQQQSFPPLCLAEYDCVDWVPVLIEEVTDNTDVEVEVDQHIDGLTKPDLKTPSD